MEPHLAGPIGEIGVGGFDFKAAFLCRGGSERDHGCGRGAVAHHLGDVFDFDGTAGIVEVAAAAVASGTRKEGAVDDEKPVVRKPSFSIKVTRVWRVSR